MLISYVLLVEVIMKILTKCIQICASPLLKTTNAWLNCNWTPDTTAETLILCSSHFDLDRILFFTKMLVNVDWQRYDSVHVCEGAVQERNFNYFAHPQAKDLALFLCEVVWELDVCIWDGLDECVSPALQLPKTILILFVIFKNDWPTKNCL